MINNNTQEILDKIGKHKAAKRILLQAPEGLKKQIISIADEIQKAGYAAIISLNPCYGACDLPVEEAKIAKVDLIVHIGHRQFYRKIKTKTPVIYIDWKSDTKLSDKARSELNKIKEQRIGLVSSVQYLELLAAIKDEMRKNNKFVLIGGHILGCWYENATKIEHDVDCFLFVGTGEFHPLGLKTEKKFYFLDLEKNQLRDMRDDLMKQEKIRQGKIMKAKDAKTFGILVTTRAGQSDMERAEKIKKELGRKDKKAFILIMDDVKNENLMGLEFDAYINTACPRIIYDRFDRPVINASDILELFKE